MSRARLTTLTTLTMAACAAASLLASAPAQAAGASEPAGPVQRSWFAAKALTFAQPDLLPQGVNDFSCRSTTHPRPIVLVHGTFANAYDSFSALAPFLKRQGFCVFTLNYGKSEALAGLAPGVYGTGPTSQSVNELSTFVDRVRSATGAQKVDLFGWSQGGILTRGYTAIGGGADRTDPTRNKVQNVVTFGSPNHGTTASGLLTLVKLTGTTPVVTAVLGDALRDFMVGSDYLERINADGGTAPGVNYTSIATRYDELATPYRTGFLPASSTSEVRNITLQNGCEVDLSDHLQGMYSPRLFSLVARAYGGTQPVVCVPNAPVL